MDWRWVLASLAVAVVAAVRLGRRAPDKTANGTQATGSPEARSATQKHEAADVEATGVDAARAGPDEDEADDGMTAGPDEAAFDVESVGAALERVWAEHAHDADTILDARLRQLVARKVPVRAIRRAPGDRAVRVAFADGTVLLCRGSGQGDFGRLGLALHRHSVRLATFAHVEDVTRLEFAWNPDHRLAAVAVGLDQPD